MEYSRPALSAVVIGAVICLVIQFTFFTLAAALGLFARSDVLVYVIVALGVIASFFATGYVTSYLASQSRRGASFLHALGSWALVETVVVFSLMTMSYASISQVLLQTGFGIQQAGIFYEAIDRLRAMNPRIESDLNLTEGKVASRIVLDEPKPGMAAGAVGEMRQEAKVAARAAEIPDGTRRTIAWASFLAFVGFIIGSASAWLGSLLEWRSRPHADHTNVHLFRRRLEKPDKKEA